MAQSLERLAKNQVLFREVNERVNEIRPDTRGFVELICECSDTECTEEIALRADEYEAVRADSTRFFVAPGHVAAEVEDVVEDHGRFLVVEKTTEHEFRAEADPRSRAGS